MGERKRVRVPWSNPVRFSLSGGAELEGYCLNISLNGALIKSRACPKAGEECALTLILLGAVVPTEIRLQGKVVRPNRQDFAVVFESMDSDALEHLRNLVGLNTTSAEAPDFEKEQQERPGFR